MSSNLILSILSFILSIFVLFCTPVFLLIVQSIFANFLSNESLALSAVKIFEGMKS